MKRLSLVTVAALSFPTAVGAFERIHPTNPVWCDAPRVYMSAPGSLDLGVAESEVQLQAAFGAWGAPECSNAHIEYMGQISGQSTLGDEISVVHWDEDGTGEADWAGSTLGLAFSRWTTAMNSSGNRCLKESDIWLRAHDHTWTTGNGGAQTLNTFNVLGHEVGHFYGLGHSDEEEALMFPFSHQNQVPLGDDDVDGICELYGDEGSTQNCEVEGCSGDRVCIDGQCIHPGDSCAGGCEANQICATHDGVSFCADSCDWRAGTGCNDDSYCSPEQGACGAEGYCMPGAAGNVADGGTCVADSDCGSSFCHEGICTTPCAANSDCGNGTFCDMDGGCGVCTPNEGYGDFCTGNSQCDSGMCVDDFGSTYCTHFCSSDTDCGDLGSCDDRIAVCVLHNPPDPNLQGGDQGLEGDDGEIEVKKESSGAGVPFSCQAGAPLLLSFFLVRRRRRA